MDEIDKNFKERLIIVEQPAADFSAGVGPGSRGANRVPPKVRIEDADEKQVEDAEKRRQDKKTGLTYAKTLPLRLIKNVETGSLSNDESKFETVSQAKKNGYAWGIEALKVIDSRWNGAGTKVAILDTGIDPKHPAFKGIKLDDDTYKDFTGEGLKDESGHGTHCAATIFGRSVDGVRIGVAPGVTDVLVGKVIAPGIGTDALVQAIQWAMEEKANVISMSLGFDFPGYSAYLVNSKGMTIEAATSTAIVDYYKNIEIFNRLVALNNALENPAIFIAASGNESRRVGLQPYTIAKSSPASAEGVISVGAIYRDANNFGVASFSNTECDVSAPGVGIVSADKGGGLCVMNGTSMACPHAAGMAALHWHAEGKTPRADIVAMRLKGSANRDRFYPSLSSSDIGLGLIQAPA